MSDDRAMTELIEGAADRLGQIVHPMLTRTTGHMDRPLIEQTLVAMAYAEGILRAVAASVELDPQEDTGPDVVEQVTIGMLDNYNDWAAARDDALELTQVELSSVVRYLTWARQQAG